MSDMEQRLQTDLMSAMKSHNEILVGALRSAKTAIQNEKTSGSYHELTDSDVVKIIQKQIKQRLESEEIYSQNNRPELAEKERNERLALEVYVPKMLAENELKSIIDGLIVEFNASSMKDMGKVFKTLNERYPNQIDSKIASPYIKAKLS